MTRTCPEPGTLSSWAQPKDLQQFAPKLGRDCISRFLHFGPYTLWPGYRRNSMNGPIYQMNC